MASVACGGLTCHGFAGFVRRNTTTPAHLLTVVTGFLRRTRWSCCKVIHVHECTTPVFLPLRVGLCIPGSRLRRACLSELVYCGYEPSMCLFAMALAHYRLGEMSESRKKIEHLLGREPDNKDALVFHRMLRTQVGRGVYCRRGGEGASGAGLCSVCGCVVLNNVLTGHCHRTFAGWCPLQMASWGS